MSGSTAAEPARNLKPIVVAVGLGADREAELVESLEASGVVTVGVRLSAEQVTAAAAARRVEAALLADDLYRLDPAVLQLLRLPVVLLTGEPGAGRWPRRRGLVTLPLEADAAQVQAALAEARRGRMIDATPLSAPQLPVTPAVHTRGKLVWVTKYQGVMPRHPRKLACQATHRATAPVLNSTQSGRQVRAIGFRRPAPVSVVATSTWLAAILRK